MNLVETLLSIKNPNDFFVDRPELIQGYTEDEIKQIEKKHHLPIHGQFKEFLMTMGKCSGGIFSGGDNIYIYGNCKNTLFDEDYINSLQNDEDCQTFLKNINFIDLHKKKYFVFGATNEHIVQYFMFASDYNDIVYEWDGNTDEVREFGTLFDLLIQFRNYSRPYINPNSKTYLDLITGKLL